MKVLITGVCGFAGSVIARGLRERTSGESLAIVGLDNLSRAGSETNRLAMRRLGVDLIHGDLRLASDLEAIGPIDWVIDAAAMPSVLAGVDSSGSSRQVVENNLLGTAQLLEFCKSRGAGLILLSTSRVYSVAALASIEVEERSLAFAPRTGSLGPGVTAHGINESFPTTPPVSLYGATKLASELLALEYGSTFDLPIFVNRCGVLAGAGQFGRIDQGLLSFWIHTWKRGRPLRYIGFGGRGLQVRDFLHPKDLVSLIDAQMSRGQAGAVPIVNLGGGVGNSLSLAQLSEWCTRRFGPATVESGGAARRFDAPWIVMDSARATELWGWAVQTPIAEILAEVADHADQHADWLEISG